MRRVLAVIFGIVAGLSLLSGINTAFSGEASNDTHGANVSYIIGAFLPFLLFLGLAVHFFKTASQNKTSEHSHADGDDES